MARLFVENTKSELKGGLDSVEKACNRVKKLLSLVRQAIRIASSYGPEEDDFRIESKDKEIPSSPPTHYHTQHEKCSVNDVTAATPAFVAYCECCGGWDTKDHFVNGPNTLWPTTLRRVLRIQMRPAFGARSGQTSS
jgi:hypothetical protein